MSNLPLSKQNQKKEWQTILAIARNNSFPANKIIKLRKQIEHKRNRQETITNPEKKDKWTTFTYYSPLIRKITNLLKNTDIPITLKSSNSLRLTNAEKKSKTQEYKCRGIYALTCKTCNHKYIGQTSRDLNKRFQEHVRYIKKNNPQSAFAQHILHNRHEYGTIEEIMKLVDP